VIKIRYPPDTSYILPGTPKILLRHSNPKEMSVIIILLIVSISIAALFLFAFLWSVKTGQFEDDYSPSSRILFDDKPYSKSKTK
jgi:cbb3-type cytochrome oxidase maturation protein